MVIIDVSFLFTKTFAFNIFSNMHLNKPSCITMHSFFFFCLIINVFSQLTKLNIHVVIMLNHVVIRNHVVIMLLVYLV